MARLSLHYSTEFRRFVLRDAYQRDPDGYCSYEMVIEQEMVGEFTYRFLVWEDGEWSEIKTKAELTQRYQDVVDHEGQEVADIWKRSHRYYEVYDDHPVFKLQRKWEAMMELNLFDIPVNLDSWQGHPLSQEAVDEMNAARDKWQREEAEAMAAEMEVERAQEILAHVLKEGK